MGIGDEDLACTIAANPFQQVPYPLFIQLLKYIIQEQDRREPLPGPEGIILSQLKSEKQAFSLPLGCFIFEWP